MVQGEPLPNLPARQRTRPEVQVLGVSASGRSGRGEVADPHLCQPPIALIERSGWT